MSTPCQKTISVIDWWFIFQYDNVGAKLQVFDLKVSNKLPYHFICDLEVTHFYPQTSCKYKKFQLTGFFLHAGYATVVAFNFLETEEI